MLCCCTSCGFVHASGLASTAKLNAAASSTRSSLSTPGNAGLGKHPHGNIAQCWKTPCYVAFWASADLLILLTGNRGLVQAGATQHRIEKVICHHVKVTAVRVLAVATCHSCIYHTVLSDHSWVCARRKFQCSSNGAWSFVAQSIIICRSYRHSTYTSMQGSSFRKEKYGAC